MPLPLLAFFGLGIGANTLANKYSQNKAMQQKGLMDQQAQSLLGAPGQELTGPSRQGGPLMSPGTGLMGGELQPLQYAQKMMQLGGPYAALGQQLMQNLLKPQPRTSQATGPMKDAVAIGLQPGTEEYAKYIRERTMKPTSQININQGGTPTPLTPQELSTYNMPPGSYITGRGEIRAPAPSRVSSGEAKQFGQGSIALKMLAEIEEQLNAGTLDPSDPLTWARATGSTIPIVSNFINLSPDEAKSKSNITQLENLVLAMIRGAQVGPEEQKLFAKQLPQFGQDDTLFAENLSNTKRNITGMMQSMSDLRGLNQDVIYDTYTDEDTGANWERIGEDPKDPNSWREVK